MTDQSDSRRRILELPHKRLALLALQLQDELAGERASRSEPIAVVGMGCRYPGGVESPDDYWAMLREGRDAVVEVPGDRWPIDDLYDPDPDAPGRIATRWGGYLDDIQRFDAAFFSISPREARAMDPQQRLLLEVAWRAFEDAGIPPARFRNRRAGVFVGLCNNDYLTRLLKEGADAIDAYLSSGNAYSVASGRLSFTWGFQGPAVTFDTACSSSLVALHGAIRSLREGESEIAVAAGVNVMCSPETAMALSRARMMAPDGRCKAFDDAADGFVRAEGCGVLILKRLSDARRDGDRIHAVLRGSALGQDGRSTGLTVPNGPAQVQVVRAALADAGLTPDEIDYIEAHGTGTSLGDPIEIRALGEVFGSERRRPLRVGSVKTNMGHLESAAGIAGVMKAIIAVREGEIPPHLHLQEPSTRIEWESYALDVPAAGMTWPETGAPRRAGVSSFGFSGTNAHVVVEQAPTSDAGTIEAPSLPLQLMPISGFTPEALGTLHVRYGEAFAGASADEFRDFCHTARVGRSELGWRQAVVVADADEAGRALAGDREAPRLIEGTGKVTGPPDVAFVFTGQGAQHPGMGRTLYQHVPSFRVALDRCAEILDGVLPLPLLDALFEGEGDGAPIYRTTVAQPAVVAFEWSLAEMWKAWGVQPAAVIGHSLGEFAAACVAGVMSIEDTLGLVAERGRLLDSLPGGDRMAAIFASAEVVDELLDGVDGEVMIGAMNSPESTVISGRAEAVSKVVAACAERGIECRELKLDKGFHSSRVEPILDALEARAGEVTCHPPSIPLARNVSGQVSAAAPSARYWRDHARQPVKFLQGIRAVAELGICHFLEVGPHPALSPMVAQTLEDADPVLVHSLRRDGDPARDVLEATAGLWVEGVPVELGATGGGRRISIPGHPLEGDRYWVDPPAAGSAGARALQKGVVPGLRVDSVVPIHEMLLTPDAPEFLAEHRYLGTSVVPGPLHAEAAIAAARREGHDPAGVTDLELLAPAFVGEAGLRVQTVLEEEESAGELRFRLLSRAEGEAGDAGWTEHARGALTLEAVADASAPDLSADEVRPVAPVGTDTHLERLAGLGFELGPGAALWRELAVGEGVATARLQAHPTGSTTPPSPVRRALLLDAAAQVLGAVLAHETGEGSPPMPRMLAGIDELVWARPAESATSCRAIVRETDASGRAVGDALLLDEQDRVVAWLRGARLGPVPSPAASDRSWHHRLEWRPSPIALPAPAPLAADAIEVAVARVCERWDEMARASGLPDYLSELADLNARATEFAAAALVALGVDPEPGTLVPDDPVEALGIGTGHHRLLGRVLEILEGAGYLVETDDGLRVARPLPTRPPDPQDGPTGPVHELVVRCGPALAGVLSGEIDPLELLFPDGGRGATRAIYRDTAFGRAFNGAIADAVASVSAEGDSPLRVLEVGAGSGSTTEAVLEALGDRPVRYLFTDLGASLVAEAREDFAGREDLGFRTLDLEVAPEAQGFDPGSHDLIIGANVVHATARIDRSLAHLRSLLAPGGILLLLEGTRSEPWVDVTFGLTDGWWRFADTDLRHTGPLLPLDGWREALGRAGFEAVATTPSDADVAATGQAVLLARKPAAPAARPFDSGDDLANAMAAEGANPAPGSEWVVDARGCAVAEFIATLQSALEDPDGGGVRVITAGAQAVPGSAIDPEQAMLWGVARCFALEHPARWAGIVDVDPAAPTADVARSVLAEALSGTAEDQVAWRGDTRYLPRLLASPAPPASSVDLEAGSYLVSGGLGGLGVVVAEWLAERGATQLVLVGRSASRDSLDAEGTALVSRLEDAGTRVTVQPLDVTDSDAVARLFDSLRAEGEPIRGIVHAAAVFDSAAIHEITPDRLRAVLGPKVEGARNLLAAARRDELDFAVFFSSTTSILGVAELGAYAAANQYLDALAARARLDGLPVTSISWGIWDEMRLASDEERDRYQRVGLRPMASSAALTAMGRAIASDVAHVVVADVDWGRLRAVYESRRARPILSELGNERPSQTEVPAPGAASTRVAASSVAPRDLSAMGEEERREIIAQTVETEVREVLRLSDSHRIDRELGFFEMGMDSLMSVELRSRLERALGLRLPSTIAFNYPTVTEASDFIDGRIAAETTEPESGGHENAAPGEDAAPAENAASGEDASPEEDVGRRLARRLAELEDSGGSP